MIKSRPFPVTFVCLYLLIGGSYFLVTSFAYLNDSATQAAMAKIHLPLAVQVGMLYLNLIISVACGMFMLQEYNWARWLYLGWGFVNLDYNFFVQSEWQKTITGITSVVTSSTPPLHFETPMLVYLLFALILLLPSTNDYFASIFDLEA